MSTTDSDTRIVTSAAEMQEFVGQEIGLTDWLEITQERVNQFADATGDHQYIHVDPERAKQTFFGGTVAHGYLTLSLIPYLGSLRKSGVRMQLGGRMGVNYGLNRVRFISPVPVGKRIRMRTKLIEVLDVPGADGKPGYVQTTSEQTIEVEGQERPACIAETIGRTYF